METISTSTISIIDLLHLTQDIASLNAVYLGIAVSALLVLAGILLGVFYFFNLKPLQEKITRQEEYLESEKKRNVEKLNDLTEKIENNQKNSLGEMKKLRVELGDHIQRKIGSAEERVEKFEKLAKEGIAKMQYRANLIELSSLWSQHYLWNLGNLKVHSNALRKLIIYLGKSIQYGFGVVSTDICLKTISESLDDIQQERSSNPKDNDQELHEQLAKVLDKLEGYDELKAEILTKAEYALLLIKKS